MLEIAYYIIASFCSGKFYAEKNLIPPSRCSLTAEQLLTSFPLDKGNDDVRRKRMGSIKPEHLSVLCTHCSRWIGGGLTKRLRHIVIVEVHTVSSSQVFANEIHSYSNMKCKALRGVRA